MSNTFDDEQKCSICGNKTEFILSDIFKIKTAHSETPISEILERFVLKAPIDVSERFKNSEKYAACQDCLIKIDEYDLAYTNAERIESELINLIINSNQKKVKAETSGILFKQEFKETIHTEEFYKYLIEDEIIEETMTDDFAAKCNICDMEFNSVEDFEKHEHNRMYIVEEISFDDTDQETVVNCSGNLKERTLEECNICGQQFHSKTSHKEHMREHNKNKYKCQICDKSFGSKILLDIHQAVHEGKSELECPFCSKVVSSKGAMVKHRRIHSKEYKYQCERCGKQFLHDTSFRMHIYAHDNTRKVSCKVCHRQFRCTPHLNRHMRIHTGEKPYSCPDCGRLFAQRYNMMMHYKSHDPNGGSFKCTICEKSFTLRKRLNEHLKVDHDTVLEKKEDVFDRPKRTPVFSDAVETNDDEINFIELIK